MKKTALIKTAIFTPMENGNWGLPLLLWGLPGVAKTAIMRLIEKRFDIHVKRLSPSENGEGAFGVTPFPIQKTDARGTRTVLTFPQPEWCEEFLQDDGEEEGILFLDEINTAPPALQPALLGAIQEKFIGGHTLGKRVRVIGAANPPEIAASGWELAAPVANRLGHIDWTPPEVEEWAAWLLGSSYGSNEVLNCKVEEARVMEGWPLAYAKASGLITSFLRRRPELLHKMPPLGDPQQSKAWPSPRSWEYATRAKASSEIHGLRGEDEDELIAAFIGTAAAGELMAWIDQADLPDPAEVLDGKEMFSHDPARLDRTEAVLSACAALVGPAKAEKRHDRAVVLWKILDEVTASAKDIAIPAMTSLFSAGLTRMVEARPVLVKCHAIMTALKSYDGGR